MIVNRGGDSDTLGAITGAICGAYYGVEAIPTRWLENLQYRQRIEDSIEAWHFHWHSHWRRIY